MVSIDSFMSRVLPFVVGCSEPMARQAILDSAIDFCQCTNVIRQTLDTFSAIKGINNYDLETPNNQQKVARILSVTVDGREIAGIFEEDVSSLNHDATGVPSGFYTTRIDSEFVLNLHPTPDAKYKIIVTAALAPTINATSVQDDLLNEWTQTVVDGAIARIAAIPNMPFTNPDIVMMHKQNAMRGMSKAKTESYYGRVRGGTRIKPRPLVR